MTSATIKRLERNTKGRDLFIGDIHGHFSKAWQALAAINFDENRDRLIAVGDLVDRGPESEFSLEWLAKPWFHAVRGNHEDMAIRWPRGNMVGANYAANGGAWMIGKLPHEQREFADAFEELPIAIELETASGLVGVVHADCPFDSWQDFTATLEDKAISRKMADAVLEAALWSRDRIGAGDSSGVTGVRAVVVGHTPLTEGRLVLGNVHFIDTWGWGRGHFTILDAETLHPAQATRVAA